MPAVNIDNPRVTFFVRSFNQEGFIRETIEAALAQDYSPLEILVLDDGSKDRSAEIIMDVLEAYAGPHEVRFQQNPRNLGASGMMNEGTRLATGEWIIMGDGDDVSMPWRVTAMIEALRQRPSEIHLIHSGARLVDEEGSYLPFDEEGQAVTDPEIRPLDPRQVRLEEQVPSLAKFVEQLEPRINGCTIGWKRSLFDDFPDLPLGLNHDDQALAFRAILKGPILFIPDPLVKWRMHGRNACLRQERLPESMEEVTDEEVRSRKRAKWNLLMYQSMRDDLKSFSSRTENPFQETQGILEQKIGTAERYLTLFEGSFGDRLRSLWKPSTRGAGPSLPMRLRCLMPTSIRRSTRLLSARLKGWR